MFYEQQLSSSCNNSLKVYNIITHIHPQTRKSGVNQSCQSLKTVLILQYKHCKLFTASQSGCLRVFQSLDAIISPTNGLIFIKVFLLER